MSRHRTPRDAQRGRVYHAEVPVPGPRLANLGTCDEFLRHVVASRWWQARFPRQTIDAAPLIQAGRGQAAFYDPAGGSPTIALPPSYRSTGIILHELAHWALDGEADVADHGRTFARLLLDATLRFTGPRRAAVLTASYRRNRVHVARPARRGPDGRWRYTWDERLVLGRRPLIVRWRSPRSDVARLEGRLDGFEESGTVLRFAPASRGGRPRRVPLAAVWDVRPSP